VRHESRPRRRGPLILASLLGLAATHPTSAAELTAILTQVEGTVQLAGPGVNDLPLATLWQIIRAGVMVHVPAGGSAGIVCSSRRFVRLHGPTSWSLTEPGCVAGKELTPGEYALVAPQAGRFKVIAGLLTLEREVRAGQGEDPLTPEVLAPRNTALRVLRPSVSWTRVPSAVEYRVVWNGRQIGYDNRLAAGDISCAATTAGYEACELPWPANRPALAPGEIYFLEIGSRGGGVEPWHSSPPVEVRTLGPTAVAALDERLRKVASLGLEGPGLEVARAGVLAGAGLLAEAAEIVRRILSTTPTGTLRVTLADIDLAAGLFRFAEPLYREALNGGSPAVRAAAAFGLGRIEYARGRFREAASEFQLACQLYAQEHLDEERAAACLAAASAAARLPH
jgi:hypothetical protein